MEFKVGDQVIHRVNKAIGYVSRIDRSYGEHGIATVWWEGAEGGWEVSLIDIAVIPKKPIEVVGDSVSFHGEPEQTTFVRSVRRILDGVADTVVKKNQAYGDSALNPIRVFSKTDRMEQLFVRLDDKLSRVQRGHEYPGDDTIRDIIGYCTLILIAREGE